MYNLNRDAAIQRIMEDEMFGEHGRFELGTDGNVLGLGPTSSAEINKYLITTH